MDTREVAELFEDLKNRVSQFNMHISETSPSDYTSTHTQKFIVQVAIAGAFYPNCFLQGTVDEELASKELYGNDPRTTIVGLCRVLPLINERFWRSPRGLSVSPPRTAETSSPSQRLTRWRGGDLGRGVVYLTPQIYTGECGFSESVSEPCRGSEQLH
ncbi:ATP-dependent RNA helicase TDRD9 isoform X2 [Ictalurus punctatus]|uniref:ATP-dependent RNA helicase TDRD9 isoform X2 n=1 Tax=Ictalurus punctatus TaxID=7998 RepID=A0A9F7REA2_ICTPU|nr:ATP-dependent RNA helicase TDRD9 isoform X2 [Ictalurus punctatus]